MMTFVKGWEHEEEQALDTIAMQWFGVSYSRLDAERQEQVYYHLKTEGVEV